MPGDRASGAGLHDWYIDELLVGVTHSGTTSYVMIADIAEVLPLAPVDPSCDGIPQPF